MNGTLKLIFTKIFTVCSHLYNENHNNTYTVFPLHFQYMKTCLKYEETNTS